VWANVATLSSGMTQAAGRQRPLNSLVESCNRHSSDTSAYLKDILERLPTHPTDWLGEVLSDTWIVANHDVRRKVAS
jgi:hypothetical protein